LIAIHTKALDAGFRFGWLIKRFSELVKTFELWYSLQMETVEMHHYYDYLLNCMFQATHFTIIRLFWKLKMSN